VDTVEELKLGVHQQKQQQRRQQKQLAPYDNRTHTSPPSPPTSSSSSSTSTLIAKPYVYRSIHSGSGTGPYGADAISPGRSAAIVMPSQPHTHTHTHTHHHLSKRLVKLARTRSTEFLQKRRSKTVGSYVETEVYSDSGAVPLRIRKVCLCVCVCVCMMCFAAAYVP